MGQVFSCVVDYLHVHTKNSASLFETNFHLLRFRQFQMFVFERAECAQWAHLRHSPRMQDFHSIVIHEGLNHGGWTSRSADHSAVQCGELQSIGFHMGQQHLPNGRNTRRIGNALTLNEFVNRLAIHARTRKHQFGACQGCAVWNAPCVNVKHGYHGQNSIPR